jgi:hypothetical protein
MVTEFPILLSLYAYNLVSNACDSNVGAVAAVLRSRANPTLIGPGFAGLIEIAVLEN